eukprot:scaffold9695_cov31-Tisochrysis_lutea.AAC.1
MPHLIALKRRNPYGLGQGPAFEIQMGYECSTLSKRQAKHLPFLHSLLKQPAHRDALLSRKGLHS